MTDLLSAAIAGYRDEATNAIWSSPLWIAWRTGRAIGDAGLGEPVACKMSRGYSARITTREDGDWIVRLSGDRLDLAEVSKR